MFRRFSPKSITLVIKRSFRNDDLSVNGSNAEDLDGDASVVAKSNKIE